MSTMVERVARALCVNEGENPDSPTPHNPHVDFVWQYYRGPARAAIEAMMEPTDGMVLSQGKSKPENAATETQRERAEALNRSVRHVAVVTWREMIQAALKEQE